MRKRNIVLRLLPAVLFLFWAIVVLIQISWSKQFRSFELQKIEINAATALLAATRRIHTELFFIPASISASASNMIVEVSDAIKTWERQATEKDLFKKITLCQLENQMVLPYLWNGTEFVTEDAVPIPNDFMQTLQYRLPILQSELSKYLNFDEKALYSFHALSSGNPSFFLALEIDESVFTQATLPAIIKNNSKAKSDFYYRVKHAKSNEILFRSESSNEDSLFDQYAFSYPLTFTIFSDEILKIIDTSLLKDQKNFLKKKKPASDSLNATRIPSEKWLYLEKSLLLHTLNDFNLQAVHKKGSIIHAIKQKMVTSILTSSFVLIILLVGIIFLWYYIRKVQSLANRQQEFIATVTHELKTPLAVVSAASQNMASGIVNSPDKVVRYGLMLDKESRRLKESIDYYLLYSNIITVSKIRTRACDIVELIHTALEQTLSAHAQLGFQYEISLPQEQIFIHCDEVAIVSVVQNLVCNAIKHAKEGKYVKVVLTKENLKHPVYSRFRKRKLQQGIFFRVIDKGKGIPKNEQKLIFEPFRRGNKASEQQIEGSGIGLNLVQRIIKLHNGQVKIEHSSAEGTTFLVIIPLDEEENKG